MGGGPSETTKTVDEPWAGQQPYLKEAFSEAQKIYKTNKAEDPYTGDFVAGATPEQIAAFQQSLGYAGPNGQGTQGNSIGMGTAANSAQYGNAAVQGAANGLFGYAGSDVAGRTIGEAGRYMNNDLINGQIDAALRDPTRQLTEQVLPGINRSAAGTGNLNSTRTGVADGIAMRGYQDTASDIASQIRSQAYNTGIAASQQGQAAQLGALGTAGGLGQGALSEGLGGIASSVDNNSKLTNSALIAGAGLQSANQDSINNDLAKYNYQLSAPYQNLAQYWNVVGNKDWGGTTTSTQQSNPSALSTIGSGVGILGALLGCDRRFKKNIKRIGSYGNGLPMYEFEYKSNPGTKVIGPMADDVRKRNPEDVITMDGFDYVHTDALTRE